MKKLTIHTPLEGDNEVPYSRDFALPTVDFYYAKRLAQQAWSPSLRTFEIICGETTENPVWIPSVDAEKTRWIVRRDERNRFVVEDWFLKDKENMYRRWAKILGKPLKAPEHLRERREWEVRLLRLVAMSASEAPNRLT